MGRIPWHAPLSPPLDRARGPEPVDGQSAVLSTEGRQIVYFQIPTLEIALARLRDPALRYRPVGIAPVHTARALLHDVSLEAAQHGVFAGMPVADARHRCPALCLLPPDPARAAAAGRELVGVISRYAPVWEPLQPGQAFLDLTGTARLFGSAADTTARIEREVAHRCGLTGVAGVGSNKLVARVAATLVQPAQLYDVRPGSERTFLAPLPVTLLPGFSRTRARGVLAILDDLNLPTLGDIAEISLPHLEAVLGADAVRLHDWACGLDPTPVRPQGQQPRLETSCLLEPDEIDRDRLSALLSQLLERVCGELRRQQRACRRLTVTIRYSDHVQASGRHAVLPGSQWEEDMSGILMRLFARLFQRRVRIRALTVGAECLMAAEEQLSLFSDDGATSAHVTRARGLALALDRIRARFGERAIRRGGL